MRGELVGELQKQNILRIVRKTETKRREEEAMSDFGQSDLKIVFKNPEPKWQLQKQTIWNLHAGGRDLEFIIPGSARRFHAISKRVSRPGDPAGTLLGESGKKNDNSQFSSGLAIGVGFLLWEA